MHSPQMVIQCFRIALQLPANSGFTVTIVKHSSDKIFLSSQLVMRVFIPLKYAILWQNKILERMR